MSSLGYSLVSALKCGTYMVFSMGDVGHIFDELELEVPADYRPKSRMKPRKLLTKAQKMGKRKSGSLH